MEPIVKSKTWARNRLIRDGIYQAIYEQMKVDPSIYLFGEGSHMKVHFDAPYIEKDFPDRITTLPICVKPDVLILGDNKPISSLTAGGGAFGGNGRLNRIQRVMKRPYNGKMVAIKARYLLPVVSTPEHPIRAVRKSNVKYDCGIIRPPNNIDIRPEWIEAKKVNVGDYLLVPRLKPRPTQAAMNIADSKKYPNDSRTLDSFNLNPATAWFLGIYTAEGSTNLSPDNRIVTLTISSEEKELLDKITGVVQNSFGRKARPYKKAPYNCVDVHFNSTTLASALRKWCGHVAVDKQIPDFIMVASDEIRLAYVNGLFEGDGHLDAEIGKISLRTASMKLALQAQLLLSSLGCLFGISRKAPVSSYLKAENRMIASKESWWLESSSPDAAKIFGYQKRQECQRNYIVTDDYILTPVSGITREGYDGDVYNIESEDSTYLVANAVVHNCEDANTNFAVGTSLVGVKPIVDVITSDFLFRTMDSISNTAAKLDQVSAEVDEPKTIVVRSEFLTAGPTTGQRSESLFTHIPGLNVVLPSNPRDARGLMRSVLTRPGVSLFFEDRMIDDSTTKESDKDTGVTENVPLGKAKVRQRGNDLTIVAYAIVLKEVESVVERNSIECDLIDPRTLYPMDFDTIYDSVTKTGRLLIVEPDVRYAGIGAELAATVGERCFSSLKKPIRRLGAPRTIIPASQGLHKYMLPSHDQILGAISELVKS